MAKLKAHRIAFLVCILGARALAESLAPEAPRFGMSFTAINDNVPMIYVKSDGNLGLIFGGGPDNAFTMGLRLDAVWETAGSSPIFDRFLLYSFLNAYTDMDRSDLAAGGWRCDFLSVMLWAEKSFPAGLKLGAGLGGEGQGNFGGEFIQNGAHRLFGDPGYSLSYRGGKNGPLIGLSGSFRLRPSGRGEAPLSPYAEAIAIADILGVARSSLSIHCGIAATAGKGEAGLEAGYRWSAAGTEAWLSGLFSSRGFAAAWIGCKFGAWTLRAGMSLNPYGNKPTPEGSFQYVQNQEYFWTLCFGPGTSGTASWLFLP